MSTVSPRHSFRVLTQTRQAYNGGTMFDVQLQSIDTGQLMWAQTFTDPQQAEAFQAALQADLDDLDDEAFRRKHGLPSGT